MTLWQELLIAVCLVLVLEGIWPFLAPAQWRRGVTTLALTSDRSIRLTGLCSMLLGVALLYLIH